MTHKAAKTTLVAFGLPSLTNVAQEHDPHNGTCTCGSRWSLEHVAQAMRTALFAKEVWT